MCAAGWSLTFVLIRLIGSATSSPTTIPAPLLPSQISPPSPLPTKNLPSSLRFPSPTSTVRSTESMASVSCNLQISPSTLVVRFGDSATANCSNPSTDFFMLGWENVPGSSSCTTEYFLEWRVDRITQWNVKPICYAVADQIGSCSISLSVIVYKPPQRVSIKFLNHTGPMYERHQYTLECTVQDVAPIGNLVVTFYKGWTPLDQFHSNRTTEKIPVNESFPLPITPCREDNGSQYWCEAKLELGTTGPQPPPVERSQNLTAVVLWNPGHNHLTKQEKPSECEVKTNHQPLGGNGKFQIRIFYKEQLTSYHSPTPPKFSVLK